MPTSRPDQARRAGGSLSRWRSPVVWTFAFVAAWVAGGQPSFTVGSLVAVGLPGAALVGYGLRPRRVVWGAYPGRRGLLAWSAVGLAFCAWELAAFLAASPQRPTVSDLADPVLAHRPARALAYLVWLLAGWLLVRR